MPRPAPVPRALALALLLAGCGEIGHARPDAAVADSAVADVARPAPDARPVPPDAAPLQPDAAPPAPDAAPPAPDATPLQPDAAPPAPDAAPPAPDAGPVPPDDAAPPTPDDAAPPTPDAAPPAPDAAPLPPDAAPVPRHHPLDYDDPAQHGPDLRLGRDDCRRCHGDTLEGDTARDCDGCHPVGWRTNCTFCHGGVETDTGAPPRALDPAADPALQAFPAHTAHVTERGHAAYGCEQCHRKPDAVTSPGHVFDATPGAVEVDFTGGLSGGGVYPAPGRCNALYCHGNGAFTGNAAADMPRPDCQGCHPRAGLIGLHGRHLAVPGVECDACHALTVAGADVILAPALHVNGDAEVAMTAPGLVFQAGMCNGACHDVDHVRRVW